MKRKKKKKPIFGQRFIEMFKIFKNIYNKAKLSLSLYSDRGAAQGNRSTLSGVATQQITGLAYTQLARYKPISYS
jgi:hypothetical protein